MYEETKLYENLTYDPHAACGYCVNYSVENIWNNVRQIIIIIYEKFQFDSLVWGSLTLAPITLSPEQ